MISTSFFNLIQSRLVNLCVVLWFGFVNLERLCSVNFSFKWGCQNEVGNYEPKIYS